MKAIKTQREKLTNRNWQCGRFILNTSETKIMGVLNCTPDSFSDGGKFVRLDDAFNQAMQMIEAGVDIIDVGGESTRPGAQSISSDEEIKRLQPIVKELLTLQIPISIDTKNTATMRKMLDLGVDIINDVNGFEDKGAIEAVKESDCGLVIMHMRGLPETMQSDTNYQNCLQEVNHYLQSRVEIIESSGINQSRICIDPGFGFGKTPQQNMQLVKHHQQLLQGKYPILIGVSRKSSLGYFLNQSDLEKRKIASIVLSSLSSYLGAAVVRVHDVKEMKEALIITEALRQEKS